MTNNGGNVSYGVDLIQTKTHFTSVETIIEIVHQFAQFGYFGLIAEDKSSTSIMSRHQQ